ncbi:MAG: Rpn family recombination-promoting nuclease/putative transposase [Candidatus Sericytochromatia bacterium]|nr:Rpn family recombination-promoting nuclease/putative transposase [Candidatus Sericytochromatia bacterium]
MSRYINPFTDFGFKKLFGEVANIDILLDFLNALEFHPIKIEKLTFKTHEKLGESIIDRKAIFDLYCEDVQGNRFIVELQRVQQDFFKDRALYYSTFAIQEQAEKGKWNYKLSGVYFVGILDFTLTNHISSPDKYIHSVVLMEKETKIIFYDKLEYKYIEVPKFNKTENELVTTLDKWLYFFKYLSMLDNIPNVLNTETFIKAFDIAEMTHMDSEKRLEYQASLKAYRDLNVVLDEHFDKGEIKGKIEVIIKLVTKKLGNIPQDIELKIKGCTDISKLDNILDDIFDIQSFQDILKIID